MLNRAYIYFARMNLSMRIIIGLALGIFTGLFFGESASAMQPIADIYIRLMQMTVLPYLVMSLVIGFGQLEADEAKQLALRGGLLLLLVWLLTCIVIALMPLAFPTIESASFFSHALTQPKQPFSVADIYFTSNPFFSLSNAVIPAVVLFSSTIGIGLIGLENRGPVLDILRVLNTSVVRITSFIVGLTPIGVFAIAANVSGTMTPETFIRLEVYFIVFGTASLLLAFVILPLLVTAMTPFRYSEIIGISRDALLTAFVANSAFIVLPMLVERTKALLEKRKLLTPESDSATEILIPILFNFPNAGRMLTLLFVPFAAWLAGSNLTAADYPGLFGVGIPSYFAKAQIALPFLMDFFQLPHDLFQLYIPTTIITGKFDSMVTAMNLLTFALLGAATMGGFMVLERRRLLIAASMIALSLLVTVPVVNLLLRASIDTTYTKDQMLRQMHSQRDNSMAVVYRNLEDLPVDTTMPLSFAEIRERGTLRIGYDPANLPFSFFNQSGELVGFDVELSKNLAASLGVIAVFVPIEWRKLPAMLANGTIDLMPGMWYRPYWFPHLRLSAPYMTGTMALAVRDEHRHDFISIDTLRTSSGLKIGVPLDTEQVKYSMERYFNGTDTEFVTLEFWQEFFEGKHPELDAFLVPAENGSAWTLLHPEYTIVVPQPNPVKVPTAFGLAHHSSIETNSNNQGQSSSGLRAAVNEWVIFAMNEGAIDRAYNYWILGEGAGDKKRRWSILHDVLGWGG